MEIFQDYLSKIEEPAKRKRTLEVLKWVADEFPDLKPRVAWNQPMFTDHGTFIIGFSVSKNHLAFTPEESVVSLFSEHIEASGYEHTKMLVRIPWSSSVDYDLLKQIIVFNIKDKADCDTFWRKG